MYYVAIIFFYEALNGSSVLLFKLGHPNTIQVIENGFQFVRSL